MSYLQVAEGYRPDGHVHADIPPSKQVLEWGKDHIVSFAGTSQFTALGVSACGLAAFNFARIAFRIEQNSENLTDVLNKLSTREVIEEIVAICAGWSSNMHLEVDDIHDLPIFSRSLRLASIEYARPRPKHFQILLETLKNAEKSTVMIITRPPEIIACFKFANTDVNPHASTSNDPVFVIFDSHPRPSHPQGAGLSFSTSIENTARALSDILPTMDETLFDSADLQWQAQLLANCSAHVYTGRHRRKDHEAAIVRSNLAILELRIQIAKLTQDNKELESDIRDLESEANDLRDSVRQEQIKANHEAFPYQTSFANSWLGRSFGLISHAAAGPSRTSGAHNRSFDAPSTQPVKPVRPVQPSPITGPSGAKSIFAHNPPPVPSTMPPSYEELELENDPNADPDDPWIQSANLALQLQNEFDSEDQKLRQERARLTHQFQDRFDHEDRRAWQEPARPAHQRHNKFDSGDRRPWQEARPAQQRQNRFDLEDRRLHQEHARPTQQRENRFDFEDRRPHQEHARPTQQRENRFDFEDRRPHQEHARPSQQRENRFDFEGRRPHQEHAHPAHQRQNKLDSEDRRPFQEHSRLVPQLQREFDSEDRRLRQEHARALQIQREFDAEDRQLREQQAELACFVQATFQCSICLDELPEDDVAKVDDCVHMMCRSCLRGFVSSKLQEHRYPIFCPMCTVDPQNKAKPAAISRSLIEQLGVSEVQSQILTEMELAEFTIQIHCRQCRRPSFVDREDYTEVFNIVCPQSDCHHVWCKKCEQTIVPDGPKHSCDGSSELDHLMKEKGWKHCPNCTTPIQKETGCNHMMCISPGCNTHFCYICGGMIVRSALNHEISEAVSAHFSKCQLFEVPN